MCVNWAILGPLLNIIGKLLLVSHQHFKLCHTVTTYTQIFTNSTQDIRDTHARYTFIFSFVDKRRWPSGGFGFGLLRISGQLKYKHFTRHFYLNLT